MHTPNILKTKWLFLFLLAQVFASAQPEFGLHFNRRLIQASDTNPAFISPYKLNISLPSAYVNFYNSSFVLSDLGSLDNGRFLLNPQPAIDQLDARNNRLQSNAELSAFGVSFRAKKFQFRLFHHTKTFALGFYPKKFMELLWQGNAPFIGQTIEVAPRLDFSVWSEYGAGFAFQVSPRMSLGTNIKYLNGLFAINTRRAHAQLFTNPEAYQLSAQTDFLVYSAGLSAFLDGATDDLIMYDQGNQVFINQNSGLAVDLGLNFQVSDRLSLAASIADWGGIHWRESATRQFSQGAYSFEGTQIKPFDNAENFDLAEVLDSINNLVDFRSESITDGFKTRLPVRFLISGQWQYRPSLSFGGLLYTELYRGNWSPAFVLNARKRWGEIFEIGTVAGIRHNGIANFGMDMTLRLAGIQIFGATDNLLPLFDYTRGRQTNLRVGINITILGKPEDGDSELIPLVANSPEMMAADSTDTTRGVRKKKKSLVEIFLKKEYYRRTDKY